MSYLILKLTIVLATFHQLPCGFVGDLMSLCSLTDDVFDENLLANKSGPRPHRGVNKTALNIALMLPLAYSPLDLCAYWYKHTRLYFTI